jgi:hypothetical protein
LDYKTPQEFAAECDAGKHGQPPKENNGATSPQQAPTQPSIIAPVEVRNRRP